MARPVGRYFASVVSQLRKLKNDEVILIDHSFKSKLRAQMVAHIGASTPDKSVSIVDRFRYLKSLKYFVAELAAVSYVVVAAVVISTHPISLNSTSAPVADSGNKVAVSTTSQIASSDNVVESPVKTFPARLALPPSMLAKIYQDEQPISTSNTLSATTIVVPPKNNSPIPAAKTVEPVPTPKAETQVIVYVQPTPAANVNQPAASTVAIPPKLEIRYAANLNFSAARKAPLEKAVYENAVGLDVNFVMVEYLKQTLVFEFHLKDGTLKKVNYVETYVPTRTNP